MFMIDLGAGLKGASRPFRDLGWEVMTVDINPSFDCDVTADVRSWHYTRGRHVDLLWFSMPCDEFARESMPWSRTGKEPDLSLIRACLNLRDEINPTYWVCENVRGAIGWFYPLMGFYRYHVGAFYFWGNFPVPGKISLSRIKKKESYGSSQKAERAVIPYPVSYAIAFQAQSQMRLLGF